jgi:hypothetical protein
VGRHAAIPPIRHRGQRVLRTAFQWLVGSVFPIAAIIGYANDTWGGEVLGGAVIASGLVTTFLSRLMADASINAWLCEHTFLGSLPRAEVDAFESGTRNIEPDAAVSDAGRPVV